MREVLPAVALREREQEVALRDVADHEHVEEAVVGLGLGQHHHPAAEVAPVRDERVDDLPVACVPVHRDPHLARLPAREDGERRPVVRDLPSERLRGLVRALRDRAADPRARDVREVRARLLSGPRPERDEPDVDLADGARERDVHGRIEIARDPVGAHEVPARPPRDHGDLDVGPGRPVHDLVDRPVAADHDEPLRAAVDRLSGERRELARLLGDERVAGEAERGGAMGDLGPALAGRAAGRGRVDEEDRADGANGRSGRRSPSRARSASSGRPPRAARRRRSGRTRPRPRCR